MFLQENNGTLSNQAVATLTNEALSLLKN